MKSNYKPIGDFIRLVDIRNKELQDITLVGVSINKRFIPSVANIIGSDMTNYKIIKKNQFACSLMQVRRDGKIPVALFEYDEAIISQAYPVFEIVNTNELLPQYLMMWMTRSELDREACFYAVGGVRGSLEWEDFCAMQLPVPSIEKQKEIIKEYHIITDRIKLNERLNQKLEDTAQSIYKEWFVNFDFPDENGKPYKSNGGEMVYCEELEMEIPEGWKKTFLSNLISIKHGFAFKGDFFSENENENILLTPGNVEIGGGFKAGKFKFYYGDVPSDYIFKPNEIMVTMTDLSKASDTLGFPAFIPLLGNKNLLHNQRLGKIEFFNRKLQYLIYLLMCTTQYHQFIISGATGTTVKHTSPTKILEYFFPFSENNLILESFNTIISSIFRFIENINVQNQKLEELKEVLLSKMATIEG